MKKLLFRSVPWLFYGLLIFFLVVYMRSIDFSKFNDVSVNYWYIFLATLSGLAFRFWGAFTWTNLLTLLGSKRVPYSSELIYIYAKSWLGRYIPGTAPWILGKIYFASKLGISKKTLGVSSLLEAVLQIAVQLIVATSLIIVSPNLEIISSKIKATLIIVLIAACLSLLPPVFNAGVSAAYRLLKRKKLDKEDHATGSTIVKGLGFYFVGTLLTGLSLFFVAKSLYAELPYEEIYFVMSVGILAGAISMLAVFAPSGIGVREAIQLALLSVIMPTELALLITIATRLWSVMVDLLFFVISAAYKRFFQEQPSH